MAYTPLLKKLNRQGSTFYTFSSAAKDLSKCLGNSSLLEFRFSHFALLNIPDIVNELSPNYDSRFPQLDGNKLNMWTHENNKFIWRTDFANNKKDTSFMLASMLQNYVFNFEERLLSRGTSLDSDRSIAERIFWHWMYRTGAIGWREARQGAESTNTVTRRIEDGDENYSRVVKYLGNIDITNNVDINADAYTELYIHVPAEAGDTPKILWYNDNSASSDISQDEFTKNNVYECQNLNWIFGQERENDDFINNITSANPAGLPYSAIYDVDEVNEEDDCYITEDSDNEGVCIDWDAESYWDIMNNAAINTMDEYNASTLSDTFEFNAVLVYYDIVNKSSGKRTTNLYGIMFLDDIKAINGAEYIQRYPKYKPTEGAVNGNSYGFKLNLRIDIEPNKQGITTLVNEYNTYSMGLFADAIMRIQECTNTFMHLREEQYELSKKYEELETVMKSIYSVKALKIQLDELERTVENAGLAFSDSNAILDLIYSLSKQIEQLVKGKLPTALALQLDTIKAGYNIDVDTSSNVDARINLKNMGWQQCILQPLNNAAFGSITKDNPFSLGSSASGDNRLYGIMKDGNNMIRVYTDPYALSMYDVKIYMDDSLSSWRKGQTIRLVFPTMPKEILNNRQIIFYTDKACRSGNTDIEMGYGCEIVIEQNDLIGDNPIIEITCIDETFNSGNDSLIADVIR
jgi:hypothetical protein